MKYLLTALAALCFWNASSGKDVEFTGASRLVGREIEVRFDSSNSLTPEQAVQALKPLPQQGDIANLKFSEGTVWLRMNLHNKSSEQQVNVMLDNPTLEACESYMLRNGRYVLLEAMGADKPFAQRHYKTANFLFDLPVPSNSSAEFLFKVKSDDQLMIPVFVATSQAMADTNRSREFFMGLYAGVIIALALYNLFLAVSTKDSSYFVYSFFIIAIGLAQFTITGYAYKYIFPNSPWLFNQAYTGTGALSGIAALLFVRRFIHTRSSMPRLDKALLAACAGYGVVIVLRLANLDAASSRATDIMGLVAAFVIYWVVVRSMRTGYRPATYFFVAWSVFLVGAVLFILRNLGVLPYNNITSFTMQVGTALEVILLSMALADKINILKREKELSQKQAVDIAQENERLVREKNAELEAAVKARTAELEESNGSLQSALMNLKSAQTQLVEQEKMASLGQLTAGIAHEINNPINFVTSNISPIRRDLDEIFEVVNTLQATAVAELTTEQRQKAVSRILGDADFDYLKEEVNTLLAGVQEGSSRTADIVKGLRLFSRLDENDLKYSDVNQGMDATLIIINTLLSNKIELEKSYDAVPPIECYAGQLNQVWLNILSNAIHAVKSRHGDKPGGKITVNSKVADHSVVISIGDNGIGMSEETKRKIFEPFFTTKEVGEGTGLGMSIAYNTIQKHHGDIEIESKLGAGTTFHITLPLVQPN